MNKNLPVFDAPKFNNKTIGGALAVGMSAAKRPLLDLRDLPNPPASLPTRKLS
ncbi:MAG: hypothetical protein KAX55_00180 [Propionivibrio sp.]|nr:hypothetical protein [Propionivibrio sp.]